MSDKNENSKILLPILKNIPLFKDLDENVHLDIIDHVMLMYYPQNYEIFKSGEEGKAMYIIKNGKVEIFKGDIAKGERETVLAEINTNGFFGEMALISEVPRNATARTMENCEVFVLNKEDFTELMKTNEAMSEQISAAVVERLNDNDKNKY